jgi:hypothetical protein
LAKFSCGSSPPWLHKKFHQNNTASQPSILGTWTSQNWQEQKDSAMIVVTSLFLLAISSQKVILKIKSAKIKCFLRFQ